MIDIPQLVERVTEALVEADRGGGPGVPDYPVLAAAAVRTVLEVVAKEAIAEAVQA